MSPPRDHDDLPFADIPDPGATTALAPSPVRPPTERPTRAELRGRARAALVLAVAWLGVEIAWFGVRGDLGRLPTTYLVGMVWAPLAAAALSLTLALSRGRSGLGARAWSIIGATVGTQGALLLAILALPAPAGLPGTPVETAYCFNVTLGFALLPMLAAGVALRRAFVALSGWRSALVGTAAGLAGAALVNLHCDRVGVTHLVLGHLGAAVAVTVVGAVLLSRVTRA
jgi:hypothetical protein